MFQWDHALIYLGITSVAAAGAQPATGVPIIFLYVFVAVFGSGLAVGIRWWQGHLKTVVARLIAFVSGIFGSGLVSPWLMNRFAMDGLDALIIIGLASMISARVIVFFTAKMDIEKVGGAGTERLAKIINPKKVEERPYSRDRYPERPYSRERDYGYEDYPDYPHGRDGSYVKDPKDKT